MPLRIVLAPYEKLIIGETVLQNSNVKVEFAVEGQGPILREKDFLPEEKADTDIRKLYLLVQKMYLESDIPRYRKEFEKLLAAIGDSAEIENIIARLNEGEVYRALRTIRKLFRERGIALVG